MLILFILFLNPVFACEDDIPFCKKVKITKVLKEEPVIDNRPRCVLRLIEGGRPWVAWAAEENCEEIKLNQEVHVLLVRNCYKKPPAWKLTGDLHSSKTKDYEDTWDLVFHRDESYPMVNSKIEPTIPKECKRILKDIELR